MNTTGIDRDAPWALLSIAGAGMLNAGNRLVELALLENMTAPAIRFSVFASPEEADLAALKRLGIGLVICSGTTLMTERGSQFWKWAEALSAAGVRCAMVGGCFWNASGDRTDTIPPTDAVLSVRDPYSRDVCADLGRPLPLVACPSLLLSNSAVTREAGERLLVGFHRQQRESQVDWFAALARRLARPMRVLVQERYELAIAERLAREADVEIVDLANLGAVDQWRRVFDGVALCVSGRLHQVLPAMARGVPSCLAVPNAAAQRDSRLSLLTYLDIPCAMMTPEVRPEALATPGNRERTAALVERLQRFVAGLFVESAVTPV
jgi:hypothetical protein